METFNFTEKTTPTTSDFLVGYDAALGAVSGAERKVAAGNLPVSTATQTALDGKANSSHTHAQSDVTNLTTDLAAKQATITGAATTIASSNLTASRAVVSDSSGKVAVATTTATEIGYVNGVTSAIQTQVDSVRTTSAQNSKSTAYTLVLGDAGKTILHPSADTTARTFTVPANSSAAYAVGTVITIVNQNAAGVITIAITTDTMRLAGAGTTGSRTLAANGVATLIKLTSTEWIISGVGLT